MNHVRFIAPKIGERFTTRDRLKREGRDESSRRFRHDHIHERAGLSQLARQINGLVGGNAAGNAK